MVQERWRYARTILCLGGIPIRYMVRLTEEHLHYVSDDDYRIDGYLHEEQASIST
jgi:hypothetical protein